MEQLNFEGIAIEEQPTVGESGVSYRLGGRYYPMVHEPTCKTCTSPYRLAIERATLRGYTSVAIERSLPEDSGLNHRIIRKHLEKHLPLAEEVRRMLLEKRAKDIGLEMSDSARSLVDHVSFAQWGLQRAFERMADGELDPDMDDAIAFANLLHKVEQGAGESLDRETMVTGLLRLIEILREMMTEEDLHAFGRRVQVDPQLRGLMGASLPMAGEG